jgi:NAD(P)-dependent dehydrogenase (short-subunit alcohol dehydrogenase family)
MLEGKIAIVTGAGRGLGRSEALQLARLGAAVVVNDYGVAVDGSKEESAAQQVVNEITSAGGKAIANGADVADWDQSKGLVDQAISEFGGLDIVVNNAGILRDRMIYNMTEDEWDAVIRVHLKGHFCMSRHATAYWREKSKEAEGKTVYGRIINTSSESYLFGSPGQPNYAAAKGGIIGLTLSTANSCGRLGVTTNAICPRARTKMTENMPGGMFDKPDEGFDAFNPDNVAPLVGFLASRAAEKVTGQVFIVHGGMVQLLTGARNDQRWDHEGGWTTEGLAETLGPVFEGRQPGAGFTMSMG